VPRHLRREDFTSLAPVSFDDLPTPPAAYKALAEANGFLWLGPPVINTELDTQWQSLNCGHAFSISYELMRRTPVCRICSKVRKKEPEDYKILGDSRGLRCLDPNVANASVETTWECNKNKHQLQASYQYVAKLVGCPLCSGQRWRIYPPEKYHELAEHFGNALFLGPPVPDCASPTWWQCIRPGALHCYQASYKQVKKRKGRCPLCRQADRSLKTRKTALAAAPNPPVPAPMLISEESAPAATSVVELTEPAAKPSVKKTAPAAKAAVKKKKPAAKPPARFESGMDSRTEERAFMVNLRAHVIHHGGQALTWREIFRLLISWGYGRQSAGRPQGEGDAAEDEFAAIMKRHGTEGEPTWQHAFRVFKTLGYRLNPATSTDKR